MATDTEAIGALTALGLTEYEARCFVAATQLSQGTAKEISRVADVPQSRVYDVTDELHDRGLIDVEESEPRRYYALPVQRAVDRLHNEYSDHLETARKSLEQLDSRPRDDDGAWTIASREDVVTRVGMHAANATEEIYLYVAHEELLEPSVLDALEDADDRGIRIYVEATTETIRTETHERVPDAYVTVSELPSGAATADDRGPGRLLMVDRETILLTAQREGLVPGNLDETGLWGSEVGHGLVAWLRTLLVARIESLAFTTADR